MKALFFILCFTILSLYIKAQESIDNFANSFALAYNLQNEGKYKEAINAYENIIASSTLVSPEVYNNIGLAYLENKEIGKAVLHFERAIKYAPQLKDAYQNLQAAQQQVKDAPKKNISTIANIFNGIASVFSANQWAVFSLLLSIGLAASIYFLVDKKRMIALFSISPILCLALIFGSMQKSIAMREKAVLLQSKVMLKKEPNLTAQNAGEIYEGTSMEILSSQDNWYKILLADGIVAWIPNSLVEKV